MNEHIENLKKAIEKIKSIEDLQIKIKDLPNYSRITLLDLGPLKDQIFIAKIIYGLGRMPMLIFEDSNPSLLCRIDYSLDGFFIEDDLKQFIIGKIQNLLDASLELISLGYEQHGMLIFSRDKIDFRIDGDGYEDRLEHKITCYHGSTYSTHWFKHSFGQEDFVSGFKSIERELGLDNFINLNPKIRDWVMA